MASLRPGDHLLSLDLGGRQRECLVRVPPGARRIDRPVVMLLHGTGGTVRWTQDEAKFAAFADAEGIVAVYPQALPPDPSAPPRFVANPPAWDDGGPPRPGRPIYDDIGFIAALLDELPVQARVDRSRVYACGFSNGASMSFHVAARLGDRIAAIGPVAGYCRVATPAVRPVPTLYLIGEDDPMVPPAGGDVLSPWTGDIVRRPPIRESLDRWARLIGATPPPAVERERDGIRVERYPGPVDYVAMTVGGLGHHWPGGRGQLKRKLAGEPSDRLDANATLWAFFRAHALQCVQ